MVSSGGMLVQKMSLSDLQSGKMNPFDGTMVYAQNKRQQVVMTHKWAEQYQGVHFASMHPGKNKLRRFICQQLQWLCISRVG